MFLWKEKITQVLQYLHVSLYTFAYVTDMQTDHCKCQKYQINFAAVTVLILSYGHETCRRNHQLQCGTEILCHGTEYMLLECNDKGRWQNLCSMTEQRLGQNTRCSIEERNAGCREWLCHLYREWLLSELTTDTSRKHKQTIWHTGMMVH